jgi:DNA replication and repair protein RecF
MANTCILIEYKSLQQRNGVSNQLLRTGQQIKSLLDVYDEQMVNAGNILFEKRKLFLGQVLPSATAFYKQISNDRTSLNLAYESQLFNGSFSQLLRNQGKRYLPSANPGRNPQGQSRDQPG